MINHVNMYFLMSNYVFDIGRFKNKKLRSLQKYMVLSGTKSSSYNINKSWT